MPSETDPNLSAGHANSRITSNTGGGGAFELHTCCPAVLSRAPTELNTLTLGLTSHLPGALAGLGATSSVVSVAAGGLGETNP